MSPVLMNILLHLSIQMMFVRPPSGWTPVNVILLDNNKASEGGTTQPTMNTVSFKVPS